MNAYLVAHAAYHEAGEQEVPWTVALDLHLQRGMVLCGGGGFLMARPVVAGWEDARHLGLDCAEAAEADCWHVWAAAGDLRHVLVMAAPQALEWISYQRRGRERVLRRRAGHLFRCAGIKAPASWPA
jgi:hypothetical protein